MILVVGATGIVGGMITQQLLEQGRDVRILVRRSSPSAELAHQGLATLAQYHINAGAEPVFGDLRDPQSLAAAVDGVETVVTTANSALRSGQDNIENVDLHGNQSLIDAAQAARVKQFIFVSALAADADSSYPFPHAKGMAERRLQESGMAYTILVPDYLMENWPLYIVGTPALQGETVTLLADGSKRHSFLSNRDLAAFAVKAVDHPAARNTRLIIGGPEALSFNDVVAVYEQVLDRDVRVRYVEPGEPLPGFPEFYSGMVMIIESQESIISMAETARRFDIKLRTVEEAVREQAASLPSV